MSAVATAIVGGAVVGAYATNRAASAQADASDRASDAQLQASRENIEFQREVFEQEREDARPWREIGTQSLEQLQTGIKSGKYDLSNFKFEADPGYQFRKQEGINALDASAAARGRLLSGAQDKAVTRYGQNFASHEYDKAYQRNAQAKTNSFNQLASLARVGQVANDGISQARSEMSANVQNSTNQAANSIANNEMNQANIRSSAYNNYAQTANQGMQNYLMYRAMG